jgi:hypothetical protein
VRIASNNLTLARSSRLWTFQLQGFEVFQVRLQKKNTSSYLCITLVKIRNVALQKKENLTSKYSKIPNVIYRERMI